MKLKAIDISVFVTLIICIIATVSFENSCKGIREEILRLHVIANSDEDYEEYFNQQEDLDNSNEELFRLLEEE